MNNYFKDASPTKMRDIVTANIPTAMVIHMVAMAIATVDMVTVMDPHRKNLLQRNAKSTDNGYTRNGMMMTRKTLVETCGCKHLELLPLLVQLHFLFFF